VELSEPEGMGERGRRRIRDATPKDLVLSVVGGLLVLFVALAFLRVNMFPVVTNDSVLYLDHSFDIWGGGWVEYGYRQVGYPLFLATARALGDVFGAEPLLTAALLQRALLLLAALLAWRFWRWWSLPVIGFMVAGQTLAYTNLLLIEGLALPLSLLLAFPTVRFMELLSREKSTVRRLRAAGYGATAALLVLMLFSLRFPYAVFGVVPLVFVVAGWRTDYRRMTIAMLGATVALMGLFVILTSIENRAEHDRFAPNVRGEPVEYYYAWQQVFTVHPENRTDPSLQDFYDEGSVHDFIREVDAMERSPEERTSAFDDEIAEMLEAAGIASGLSRAESSLHALTGGRLHDTGGVIGDVVASRNFDTELVYLNEFAQRRGHEAFVEEYNRGRGAGALLTNSLRVPLPTPSTKALIAVLLPMGLIVMVIGLTRDQTGWISVAGLLVVTVFAVGIGIIRADNMRFLLPTSGFGIAMGTAVLALAPHPAYRAGLLAAE